MTNQARPRGAVPALVLACVLAGGSALAATGRVRGQVTDPEGRPIEGVAVTAAATRAVTDAGGLYSLEGVETGRRVSVAFAKPGYATTWGVALLPAHADADGDSIPDERDRCPRSDLRPAVTIDGCDTGLGNRMRDGCTAMDVFLDCAEDLRRPSHLASCLADPRFIHRVDHVTSRNLRRAMSCVQAASLPLDELDHRPALVTPEATLHRTLLPVGAAVTLDAASGGTVEHLGFKVTFAPGSIGASGAVDVVLTPLDVTGPALGAFPGDARAVSRSHRDALLETWGLLDVRLTQGGHPVRLIAPATIEVPLPAGSPFQEGARIGLWSFDKASGLWMEAGSAGVLPSTVLPGRLAAVGPAGRPGWWNVDRKIEAACLCGQVTDADGQPVEGALVTATGLDYFGTTTARSDEDGSYCVEARRASRVAVRASAVADGLRLDSAPVEVETPSWTEGCAGHGCGPGPELALPEVSCVCGQALDELGAPRPGVKVATSAGSAAATDADGRFCLGAPAEQTVTVFGDGYPPAPVETPAGGSCPYGCAVVDLVPPTQTTCVTGKVIDDIQAGIAMATVVGLDERGVSYGPVETDARGFYTLRGLPPGTRVRIHATSQGRWGDLDAFTATEPGGACTLLPDLDCGGPS